MNICLISSEYPPETGWGGIGTYTHNLARALTELGHEVHVITKAVRLPRDYDDEEVHVHRIKAMRFRFAWSLSYGYSVYRKLRSISCKFDIVEAPEWGAEGYIQSLSNKPPLVTRLHTPFFLINRLLNRRMRIRDKMRDFLEKEQTSRSLSVSSPTETLAREVSKSWNIDLSRIKVIPNGLDVERIRSVEIKPDSVGSPYLLYVGRLEERKGVHILAKALPGVFRQHPNLKMIFVGKDMAYGNTTMKDFVLDANRNFKGNIVFTDFVSEEEKYSLVKHCRYVVLPSLWENQPYTCLESMVLGKVVIATKGSGFNEIIEKGSSGFLVKPGDYKTLEERMLQCLSAASEAMKQMERKAQRRAEDFDIKVVSKRMVKYYERVLEKIK